MKFAFIPVLLGLLVFVVAGCANDEVDNSPTSIAGASQPSRGEDAFWKLIDTVDRHALKRGDEQAAIEPLFEALASASVEEIEQFEEHLTTVLYRLDGRTFAENAGGSGSSDDGFLYARCYVVGLGREKYEATLRNPKRMPKNVNQWFESLLYVAADAWAEATESDVEDWSVETTYSYETGSNKAQW